MLKKRYEKAISMKPVVKVLVFSIILSSIFSAGVYLWILNTMLDNLSKKDLLMMFISVLWYMLIIIFIFLGFYLNNTYISKRSSKNFDRFKEFAESLYNANSENEAYENLFTALSKTYSTSKVSLYYNAKDSRGTYFWKNLSNEKIPLCNMVYRDCPVVNNETSCFIDDIPENITCAYQFPEYNKGCYLCLYIKVGNKVTGVVQLYNKNKNFFTDSIVENINAYLDILNPILISKKTLKQLNKSANTDNLTKIFNRSYFDKAIEKEFEISRNKNLPLSLIIIDIDFFKKVNDNYGHQGGDKILQIFAQVILLCVRKSDIVARYGGEEFIVILPNTNLALTKSIAERIRSDVELKTMPNFQGKSLPSITCSLGVSTYPNLSNSIPSLLKTADIALYKAKSSGRNNFKVFSQKFLQDYKE